MAYSQNILPKASAYYSLNRASIVGTEMRIEAGGSAEIRVSAQMLPLLTSKMLVVVHPSVFSDGYSLDAVQVTLSIMTMDGERIECLIPVSYSATGVFNTEIDLPEGEYTSFEYKVSSAVDVTLYNWELCGEQSSGISTVIDGVEQAIPRLLYDYNMYSYAIGQREQTVGLITCFLKEATDLQGHFTISFFATERCNVFVRIKDNGITELFSPQWYTVEKGYASISIPHAYLNKFATDHSFAVTMQCSNGQLSIPVRGMLYTIDGGYLATRLLDAGVDVQDISIKQTSEDTSPTEIWAIGYESERLILKHRTYSQLSAANWTAVKDFGEGLGAGVEFRGSWINRDNSAKYTIETDEQPWVFIINTDNILSVYSGENYEDIKVLDTGVSSLAVCQGFSSIANIAQDQGMVVVYIKNGNVYYRHYAYDAASQSNLWFGITALYELGDAVSVSVHRLPDYRMGICVEHSTGTKWYITDRTYVNQAVKPEIIRTRTDSAGIVTIMDADKADVDYSAATLNEFAEEEDMYYNGFTMTFIGPLVLLSNKNISDFKRQLVVTVEDKEVAVKSVQILGQSIVIFLEEDVFGGKDVVISYNFPFIATMIYNGSLSPVDQTHTWLTPLPTTRATFVETISADIDAQLDLVVRALEKKPLTAPSESVDVEMTTELNLEVKEVSRPIINAPNENMNVSLDATASLTVTQTGAQPI